MGGLRECLGDEHKICLLYLVLPIAVVRSYRLVPLPDPLAVFVGLFDIGELLEEYLRPLLLVVGPLLFAIEKETPLAVQELLECVLRWQTFPAGSASLLPSYSSSAPASSNLEPM